MNSPTPLTHPALDGCRRLFVRNHELLIGIGVHAFEKSKAQRVLVNVEVWVPLAATKPAHDRLDEVYDYDRIHHAIERHASRAHVELQETLVDAIALELLAHPLVRAVRIATEKPDVYPNCDAVGVEVFHLKEERS